MDTQTQIDRLIELAIIQRTELKQLVEQLPQLREHLNSEVEKVFDEVEPQLRVELEEWAEKKASDSTAKLGNALEAKIAQIAADLQVTTQARFDVLKEQERKLEQLRSEARSELSAQVAILPETVKEIVGAELARFPRAGEIEQLRKEFAEPRGLNPRGKWQAGETYNRLDLVTVNGDSFVSNIDGNKERPSRTAANWTLSAARGMGGGSGFTSLNNVLGDPSAGQIVGSEGGQYVRKTLVAGANITINETATDITIVGDEGEISLEDGTAASPALFFTNDPDTGIYRPAANTLGISVSGTQVAYFDENGLTVPSAGVVAGGSIHAGNGNANNPSLSFDGDQDTGFFRHQPNELGIALGGTQYATLTSTTFSITPNISTSGNLTVSGTGTSSFSGTVKVRSGFGDEVGIGPYGTGTGGIYFGNGTVAIYNDANTQLKSGNGLSLGGNLTVSADTQTKIGTSRPFLFDPSTGKVEIKAGAGGWDIGYKFQGSAGTAKGGFGAFGDTDALTYFYVGPSYSSTYAQFASTGTTLAGNLTVSGTGTSSFAGSLQANGGTAQSVNTPALRIGNDKILVWLDSSSTTTNAGFLWYDSSNILRIGAENGTRIQVAAATTTISNNLTVSGGTATITGSTPALALKRSSDNAFVGYIDATTAGTLRLYSGVGGSNALAASFPQNGNFLLGTTTDSGNGKLQLATHTTSAGGIGLGTNLSIYRSSDNSAWVDALSGNAQFILGRAGTANLAVLSDGSNVYASAVQAGMGLIFRTNGSTTALTLDSSQNATFAGRVRAGTAVGTAKTVMIDAAFTTLLNVTKTFTVTMPSPSLASSFVLEVGVYGNTATGYASLMVKGGGYLGSSTLYEATELTKINSGSVTISSVTKANGTMTFTVINTSSSGHVAICYKQTADDVFTTLPTITAV